MLTAMQENPFVYLMILIVSFLLAAFFFLISLKKTAYVIFQNTM